MDCRTRLWRAPIALALGGVLYASTLSARGDAEAMPGCPYTAPEFVAPAGAEYGMNFLETSGGGFYYHYASNGHGPLVVLVAGVPEPHYFDALRALLLGAEYRVLILDLPGKQHKSLSSRPTAQFVFEQYQELWTRLGLDNERDFSIVGTSISGPVTALMAARWANQQPKLVLVSALGMTRKWPLLIRIGRAPILSDLLAPFVLRWQFDHRWQKFELLCPGNYRRLFQRQELEYRGGFARINYLELSKTLALSDQAETYKRVGTTGVPVMLAYGDRDPFCDQVQPLQNVMPKARVTWVEDSAHIVFVEQPEATFGILDKFARGETVTSANTPTCDPR